MVARQESQIFVKGDSRSMSSRREFLQNVLISGAGLGVSGLIGSSAVAFEHLPAEDPWIEARRILRRIKAPIFPGRDFSITRFGAVGNARADCTEAFAKAISACSRAGGGRVLVPEGEFLTGAIHLKSNVNLHVTKNATIRFDRDPMKYLPVVFTRWEGMELMSYSAFIYAFGQRNIAITGEGVIDGQADCDHWWPWKGRPGCGWKRGDPEQTKARRLLYEMVEKGTPVKDRLFGEGSYLRPNFIQPYRCDNVLIEGVTLRHSPMWQLHPVLCRNVTIRGVKIEREAGATEQTGPNADGCDPESCRDVLIRDCTFNTGDDCIAIKSGRNNDGRRVAIPSENIVIQNCQMRDGHGGITIGSEISAGVRNVFAENCQMDSPNLNIAIRFKNNALRGGQLENFYFRNIEVGQVSDAAVTADFNYEEGANGPHIPRLRHLVVENLRSGKSKRALDLQGLDKAHLTDIQLANCTFERVADGNVVKYVDGLSLRNVRVNGKLITSAS
jgi:polygalacturonase